MWTLLWIMLNLYIKLNLQDLPCTAQSKYINKNINSLIKLNHFQFIIAYQFRMYKIYLFLFHSLNLCSYILPLPVALHSSQQVVLYTFKHHASQINDIILYLWWHSRTHHTISLGSCLICTQGCIVLQLLIQRSHTASNRT